MSQTRGIAVFDFDGTLTESDSFLAFIRYVHGWRTFLWGFLIHSPLILRFFLGHIRNDELKSRLFAYFFADIPANELRAKGRQFSLHWIPKALLAGASERLAWHQSQEHEIIILSASSDLWLGAWCEQEGYSLIATKFLESNGHFIGEIDGKNCHGKEKERRIIPHLESYLVEARYGYGDRRSDQAYLQHCGHANHLPLRTGLAPYLYRTNERWSPLLYRFLTILMGLLFACLPFSLGIDFGVHQLNIPAEPLLGLSGLVSILWFGLHGRMPKSFYRTPLAIASLVFVVVLILTSVTSTMPMVSLKYTLVALVHWWIFFHTLPLILDHSPRKLLRPLLIYTISFLLILCYAWWQHAQYNFRIDVSVLTARPFYFDHALYSCCALLLLGTSWVLMRTSKEALRRILFGLISCCLLLGVYLSFSRAAWLSAFLAGILAVSMFVLKQNFKYILILAAGLILSLILTQPTPNASGQESNASTAKNPWEHLSSALNTSTNVSNLERLNRYSCALRLFKDRPLLGFGPGTFQYQYLGYQLPEEMTSISVTEHARHRPGKGGGAHSEYLQGLSESGVFGLLSWVVLIIAFFHLTSTILNSAVPWESILVLGIVFSLSTYFIHGLFNNFLHNDKVAALVWGSLAILQVLYLRRQASEIVS